MGALSTRYVASLCCCRLLSSCELFCVRAAISDTHTHSLSIRTLRTHSLTQSHTVEYWTYQSTGKGKISPDRIRRLEEIGMEWDPQRAQWKSMVAKLKVFAEAHGHCKVPKGYQVDPELANWVRNQRLEYANLLRGKRSRMTQERTDLLNSMGFRWSTSMPSKSKNHRGARAAAMATAATEPPVAEASATVVETAAPAAQQVPEEMAVPDDAGQGIEV